MQPIELLSPAKDPATGIAAIQCGADALYIGGPRFGAREAAGNSLEEIKKVVDAAHPFYARVYVTLNTLLFDEELSAAERMIRDLHDIGVDGLIIQDCALLELDLPPIPLIASTQMNNDTPAKVKFLEDVGFSRVILARELTLDQIREIRRETSIELECFIHGALCVGASGQCYMSYALGGRSGNRGQCAQPCRRMYRLEDPRGKMIVKDRHLLSLMDMNRSDRLDQLLDAGVTSFKIEGRLKDISYVANITGHYRRLLDELLPRKGLQAASSGKVELGFMPDPARTFNRGYTEYGLDGKPGKIGSIDTPKSMGQFIGPVRKVGPSWFELDRDGDLHNGDGLCFFDRARNLQGTVVNGVDGRKIFPQKMEAIAVGTEIYRNHDHQFSKVLQQAPARRKIGLAMRLYETPGGIALEGTDAQGNRAVVEAVIKKEPAEKPDAARQTIPRQVTKLGNTIFECTDFQLELAAMYFFPVSVLNQLKRDLVEAMLKTREVSRPRLQPKAAAGQPAYPQDQLDYRGNVLNRKAVQFYREHGVEQIEPAAESGLDLAGRIVMTTSYCIRRQLNLCPGRADSESAEDLVLVDEDGRRFQIRFRCSRCGMDIFQE